MKEYVDIGIAYRAAATLVTGLTQDHFLARVVDLCARGTIDASGYKLECGRIADPHIRIPITAAEWCGSVLAYRWPGVASSGPRGWTMYRDGAGLWSGVLLRVSDVESAFSGKSEETRGRPKKLDWEMEIYPEIFRLMDFNGEFSIVDPDWYAQACLEKQISAILEEMVGDDAVPVESTIRRHVVKALTIWRSPKADK